VSKAAEQFADADAKHERIRATVRKLVGDSLHDGRDIFAGRRWMPATSICFGYRQLLVRKMRVRGRHYVHR
jgi:hypothetical protein